MRALQDGCAFIRRCRVGRTVIAQALALGGVAASCVSYQPLVELWPASDAGSATTGGAPSSSPSSAAAGGGSSGFFGSGSSGAATSAGSAPPTSAGSAASVSIGAGSGGVGSSSGGGSVSGPSSGASSSSVSGTSNGASASSAPPLPAGCSLAVSVTTATNNGAYSPENVGAIWIAHAPSGAFVKTLAMWAGTRINHLTLWNSVTVAAGKRRNTVDAVTGATLFDHETHDVVWNCKDTSEATVPDGAYQVVFEMDDDNSTGPHASVNFTKGPTAAHITPPDTANFKAIRLTFTP